MSWDNFLTLISGIPYTLAVTFGALIIGAIFGFPLMLMRTASFAPSRYFAILLIALVRSIPPIVWVFLIFFAIGSGIYPIGPLPAALISFGIIATVNLAEIYRGGILAINAGQSEAAAALNMSRMQTFIDIIAPQMFRVSLPMMATYAIGLLKDAAIASTIGVPDLSYQGRYLTELTYQGLQIMGMVGLLYILISLPIAWLSRYANAKLTKMVSI